MNILQKFWYSIFRGSTKQGGGNPSIDVTCVEETLLHHIRYDNLLSKYKVKIYGERNYPDYNSNITLTKGSSTITLSTKYSRKFNQIQSFDISIEANGSFYQVRDNYKSQIFQEILKHIITVNKIAKCEGDALLHSTPELNKFLGVKFNTETFTAFRSVDRICDGNFSTTFYCYFILNKKTNLLSMSLIQDNDIHTSLGVTTLAEHDSILEKFAVKNTENVNALVKNLLA